MYPESGEYLSSLLAKSVSRSFINELFIRYSYIELHRLCCELLLCFTMSESESDNDSNDIPSTSAGAKRKKYSQNYKKEWELKTECSNWLKGSLKGKNYAYCHSCNKDINISSGFDAVKRHAASQLHIKSVKNLAVQPKMTGFVNRELVQFKHQVREGMFFEIIYLHNYII